MQALKDMDTETLRKILGDVNLPSWINFPGAHVYLFQWALTLRMMRYQELPHVLPLPCLCRH